MDKIIAFENQYNAPCYAPLPVVLTKGEGIYVFDAQDKRYIDMMSAYSAVSHGHCHPRLVAKMTEQAQQLGIVSRAFYSETLGPFLQKITQLTGLDQAIPMNTGAEAVETAIKTARKWAYDVKGVEDGQAEIIACQGNFHGRTLSIISFSSEPTYQKGFSPLTPGFKIIPYGDSAELEKAITQNTAAFIVEPIQGENGIIVPPKGYLKACAEICRKHNVLLICDEIQTGLGRTGKFLASYHDDVQPDGVTLGKALGGGLYPVSLFLSKKEVMKVMTPGTHGSTFGGNPLAAAIALEALNIIQEDRYCENAFELGEYLLNELTKINSPLIKEVRGKGLFIALEINPNIMPARTVCNKLLENGLLTKDTHGTVVRLAPPLIITKDQIDDALGIIKTSLSALE